MGGLFSRKQQGHYKPYVMFPKTIEMGYVHGGDLIFIEEDAFFDGYTKMNSQVLHAFKKALRLKQDMDNFTNIKQWSRIGIIIDSDVEGIKYVLELTPAGFIKSEFVSRLLDLKAAN
jgi:hypothetical protein